MKKKATAFLLLVCLWQSVIVFAQTPSLRGTVKDPSGAAVPGATVQLSGSGREQRKTTDVNGQFSFPSLVPGKYQVRITAKGFAPVDRRDLEITQAAIFDAQLEIQAQEQKSRWPIKLRGR
jgi:hypothetical protein